jgi:hypothetical protein
MSHGSSSNNILKRRCKDLNISCEHFHKTGNGSSPRYELEEILIENSPYTNNSKLAKRLLKNNLLIYKCEICGNTGEWQNKPLTL